MLTILNLNSIMYQEDKDKQNVVTISILKSKNINKAELETSNPIAINLYKKFGFYHNKNAMKSNLELL